MKVFSIQIKPNKLIIGSIISVLSCCLLYAFVMAYSNPCYKDFCSYNVSGYFDTSNKAHAGSMEAILPNGSGDAIPGDVKTVDKFITFLKNKNVNSESTHNRIGSAFIVCKMLQEATYKACFDAHYVISKVDITTDGWNELTKRLGNKNLTFDFFEKTNKKANFINSAYDSVAKDAFVYTRGYDESGDAIVISSGGKAIFRMFRHCANPLDGLPGLPPPESGNFTLNPNVDAGPDVIESGGQVTIDSNINNSGDQSSTQATWNLTKSVNGGAASSITSGSTDVNGFPVGQTALASVSDSDTDKPAGTDICYVLSVIPHSTSDPTEVFSQESCVVIATKPKVQVWGGDLSVGRQFNGALAPDSANVQTSTSIKGTNTFGSWVEYAIFATGTIKGTASASGFAGSSILTANICSYSTLSFANTQKPSGCADDSIIGNYSNASTIPDILASFPGSIGSLPNPVSLQDPGIASGSYLVGGDITLSASTLPTNGKYIVIKAPGKTVTIAGDQKYANDIGGISQLPQLIIIADKIIINDNVSQVDAWLIAKNNEGSGEIVTCNKDGHVASECGAILRVNGPVMTQHLKLNRTGGATISDAAEIFNLRPDAYLWAYNHFYGKGAIRTVYSTELPPRL